MKKIIVFVVLACFFAGCSKTTRINEIYDPARTETKEMGDFVITIKPLARSIVEEKKDGKIKCLVTYEGTGWEKNPVSTHKYTVLYISVSKKTSPDKGGKIQILSPMMLNGEKDEDLEIVAKSGIGFGEGDKSAVTLKNRAEHMTFDKGPIDGLLVFPNLGEYDGKVGLILPFKYFDPATRGRGSDFELRTHLKVKQEF